jgi:hypothetical protein
MPDIKNGQMTLDVSAFGPAMKKWFDSQVKPDAAAALNSVAGDVAYEAEKLTRRADAGKMDQKFKVGGGNVGILLKSGKRSKSKQTRYQTFQASKLVYGILRYYRSQGHMPNWKGVYGVMPKKLADAGIPAGNLDAAAKFFVSRKKSSIAYIATGWLMTAAFFGKTISRAKVSNKGLAYLSTGKKATANDLTALLMNFARGADKAPEIADAMQKALDLVGKDLPFRLAKGLALSAKKAGFAVSP